MCVYSNFFQMYLDLPEEGFKSHKLFFITIVCNTSRPIVRQHNMDLIFQLAKAEHIKCPDMVH